MSISDKTKRIICGLIIVSLTVVSVPLPRQKAVAQTTEKPNVLVIMTDDQTVEQMRWLPSVKAYMAQGTEYTTNVLNYPLCGPSRVTFLTGQHATNHGLDCNPGIASKFHSREVNSLAPWLDNNGVHTIHVGKYLNGYGGTIKNKYVPAGWDDWRGLLGSSAYNYTRFDMLVNGTTMRYGQNGTKAYSTDVLSNHLDEALRATPEDQPFFAVYTPLAPHIQGGKRYAVPAPRHENMVSDVLRPRNYNGCIVRGDECPATGSSLNNGAIPSTEMSIIDNTYQTASESLFAVDEAFNRITSTLSEMGRLDNTVIMFTSDNGFFYGEHGIRQGKVRAGREALIVPLFIAGPGFNNAAQVTSPVSNIDLAPTILDIFDTSPTITMDGQSLLEPVDPKRVIFIQADTYEGTGYRGVYADGWIYFRYKSTIKRGELYAPSDPYQIETLDNDDEWNTVESELSAITTQMTKCSGTIACRLTWTGPSGPSL